MDKYRQLKLVEKEEIYRNLANLKNKDLQLQITELRKLWGTKDKLIKRIILKYIRTVGEDLILAFIEVFSYDDLVYFTGRTADARPLPKGIRENMTLNVIKKVKKYAELKYDGTGGKTELAVFKNNPEFVKIYRLRQYRDMLSHSEGKKYKFGNPEKLRELNNLLDKLLMEFE